MAIHTECPLCGYNGPVPDEFRGKAIKCPECCHQFYVANVLPAKPTGSHPRTVRNEPHTPAQVHPKINTGDSAQGNQKIKTGDSAQGTQKVKPPGPAAPAPQKKPPAPYSTGALFRDLNATGPPPS